MQRGGEVDLAQEPLRPSLVATSGRSTLMATWRLCLRSRARNTVAMPPRPELTLDGVSVDQGLPELFEEVSQ